MKSLLSNSLQSVVNSWSDFNSSVKALAGATGIDDVYPCQIEGLQGCGVSFFTASLINSLRNTSLSALQYSSTGRYAQSKPSLQNPALSASFFDCVLVVSGEKEALELHSDLVTCFENDCADIDILPWWGLVPYRCAAPGSAVFGRRSGVLAKMALQKRPLTVSTKPRIFIVSQRSLQTPVPSPEYVRSLIFSIYKGQEIDPQDISDKLSHLGYIRVPKVTVPGEFTLRGEVLDIYTPGEELPTRIVFDFDVIENIKSFNPETQSTVNSVDSLLIYPMKEVIWNEELIDKLKKELSLIECSDSDSSSSIDLTSDNVRYTFTDKAKKARDRLINDLENTGSSEGEELYYPVVFDSKYTILDYIDERTPVIFLDYDRLNNSEENVNNEYTGMFRRSHQELPVFPPSRMLVPFKALSLSHEKRIFIKSLHTQTEEEEKSDESVKTLKISSQAPHSYFGNLNFFKEELESMQMTGWKVFVFADNENQSLRIKEILKEFIIPSSQAPDKVKKAASNRASYYPVSVLPYAVSQGFTVEDCKVCVIQENEIFGRRKHAPKSIHKGVKSEAIETFIELNPGDYVVHVNYGIGRFKGIQRIKAMGNERDFIKLEYAADKDGPNYAFVPIEQVNLVQRYIGNEGDAPSLDVLGSKSWENRKNKVKKAVEDLAQKLIDLYSRRKASRGYPFPKDTEWQTAFEAAFPYEDTKDQVTVTQEIKADMEKDVPMDRLVCGDVGYGKTEIAMRAAFKAVSGGKQVAFLAPTTILAEQHYENCVERFANFPVTIAHMSRFVSPKEQKEILKKVAAGQVDVLVGTHRIIQKDVVFKDLGLMIIDEEQRFGVKDKEKLKTMKTNIDSLAMSATPIPRTLHMSLLKIRDMSLLTTPPQTRKPIETVVDGYSEERVCQAIRREVERGGQVFYLHNRVESLEETRLKLMRLLPEMMIEVAHGQMSSEELDDIFRRFKMGGFHVLVATTIIENGIDIPNVNTIIIDRADMYGVSQLYQLRGRVGRSDRKAYAYLLYPENKVLNEVAMKRLQVISDFTELGSGFKIAMKDMEIRGAGNLLGRDQSGDVYSVGFDLYVKLLTEAVNRLSKEDYKDEDEVLLELEYTGFIPDTYITNLQTKMEIYKKVAGVKTKEELDRLYAEIEDRFGPVPDEVYSLLSLAEVRILARRMNIRTLREKNGIITADFAQSTNINIDKLLKLVSTSNGRVRLDPSKVSSILISTGKIGLKEKSQFLREELEKLV